MAKDMEQHRAIYRAKIKTRNRKSIHETTTKNSQHDENTSHRQNKQ
jgi:hypothetical protein